MNPFIRGLSVAMALTFLFFSWPKLTAAPVSVSLFETINGYMGWTGSWFRVFTGLLEIAVGAVLLLGAVLTRSTNSLNPPYGLYLIGLLGTMGTMTGALFVELAIRPGEDLALTILAFVLLGLAAFLLWPHRRNLPVVGGLFPA